VIETVRAARVVRHGAARHQPRGQAERTLIANSQGHDATDRINELTVGPTANATATTSALRQSRGLVARLDKWYASAPSSPP
jgi:hypothetical protein